MALYDRLTATALRLLTAYGREVTLRQLSVGSADYNPATGESTPAGNDGTTDTTRFAVVLDQPGTQISQRFGNNKQANSLVQQSEKWLYMDANGVAPALQDKLIIDAIEYTIEDVQVTAPGGVVILYMLMVRA